MTQLALATIQPVFLGVYNGGLGYRKFNMVRYDNNLYMANQDVPPGVSPDNAAFWDLLIQGSPPGALVQFEKADHDSPVLQKTDAETINLKAGTVVTLNGEVHEFSSATPVILPSPLTAGTDYTVFVCSDGSVRASTNFSAPDGYAASQCYRVGGFHFALGNLNIDATPHINQYSIWDRLWRPTSGDPRGMALIAGGGFWADIYLLGVNPQTDGTSKAGVTIANGSTPPKVPEMFGGGGGAAYSGLSWHNAGELFGAHGKRLPQYWEFSQAAYGVTEQTSAGTAASTTARLTGHVSKWGLEQATGVLWQWGDDFGGPDSGATPAANTGGRGSVTNQPNAAMFGGAYNDTTRSGSRAGAWNSAPASSVSTVGARGFADHFRL